MKTLHLDTRPDWRGGQNQILLLMRGLRARGHGAELVALEGSPLARRAASENFPVYSIPGLFARARATQRLKKLLADGFDVVHAHDPHALTAAWLAGTHRRTTLIVARRVIYELHALGLSRYRAAHRILAVSRFVAESVTASGIPSAQVEVVYDGVELPAAASPEQRLRARARWGVRGDEILLGCVGYLVPGKGQEHLLGAMAAVRARFPNCRLLLAGDGPCRPQLERTAGDLGLSSCVVFAGFVEDPGEVYRGLDCFIFPAVDEALGTSLLAAMAHSLPAIAVASGGVPEVIEDGVNGLLIPNPEAGAIARCLLGLLGERVLAARLGAAARETIAARFTADRMVEQTLRNYEQCLPPTR
jgi:glycosyltransferase involved in cell wall biosynthesis